MGMILIYGIAILLFLAIITIFVVVLFKRKGKTKIGFLIVFPIVLLIIYCLFINNFDELLISKSDVRSDLKNAQISLNDDFEVTENSVIGFPERFQKTKLKISEADFSRIQSEIKNASDFRISEESGLLESADSIGTRNKNAIVNYSWNEKFIRESYSKDGDYVPIYLIISLDPVSKMVEYERIED